MILKKQPISSRTFHRLVGLFVWGTWATLVALFPMGCTSVNVAEQRLVSKANMTFSDSPVFSYTADLHSRVEPGTAGSGGGQASGCTSCK